MLICFVCGTNHLPRCRHLKRYSMLSYTHDNVTICFCCGLCAELTIFRAVEIMSLDNAADGHPSSKLTRHKFPDPHHSMLLGGDMYATAGFLKTERCLSVNIVQRGQGWKTRHRFQFSFDEGGGCSCACPQILFLLQGHRTRPSLDLP